MSTRPAQPGEPLAIEFEMRREVVSSLRYVGRKLEEQLAELASLAERIGRLSGPARAEQVAVYQELYRAAEHQRWCLTVQREAMGLRSHGVVDETYPRPPRIR